MCCLSYYPSEFLTQLCKFKTISLDLSHLKELLDVKIGDCIQGVGVVQTRFEQKFVAKLVEKIMNLLPEERRKYELTGV